MRKKLNVERAIFLLHRKEEQVTNIRARESILMFQLTCK